MTTTAPARATDTFGSHLEALLQEPAGSALAGPRRAAFERFQAMGYPTTRSEEWRYTDVSSIARTAYLAPRPGSKTPAAMRSGLAGVGGARLVFVNGRLAGPEPALPAGAEFHSLARLLGADAGGAADRVGALATPDSGTFVALNAALFADAALLVVRPGAVVAEPIHILHIVDAGAEPVAVHPRLAVTAGPLSQVTVIETYLGAQGQHLTNAVTEFTVGDGAVVDHYKVQAEAEDANHIASMHVLLGRDARFTSHSFALGGAIARSEVAAVLNGTGAEATLNGLYHVEGRRHVDTQTVLDHAQPHCSSHELYKGVLDHRATSAFSGKIIVRPDAQKTDAKQTNQNLLLSPDAVADTRPQLEIFADDVRCTHGATIGQLDDEALFYLRSRGIGHDDARAVLTRAFAGDIVGRVKVPALRRALEMELFGHVEDGGDAVAGEQR